MNENNLTKIEPIKAFFKQFEHDIRTPLSIISTASQILPYFAKGDSWEINEIALSLQSASNKLMNIALNALNGSLADNGLLEISISPCNIRFLINIIVDRIKSLAPDHIIDFTDGLTTELFKCDAALLSVVVFNILENAVKFSSDNSHISIHAYTSKNNNDLHIDIQDNGIGMNKEQLSRIYDLFYQADTRQHKNGGGIGLYVVKQIIDLHNGQIACSSTPTEGTLFRIILSVD